MTDSAVMQIGLEALLVAFKIAGPILIVTLGIGLAVGLVQSVTQLQEQTLTFVPKCFGVAVVILLGGAWMLHSMVSFTHSLFERLPSLLS